MISLEDEESVDFQIARSSQARWLQQRRIQIATLVTVAVVGVILVAIASAILVQTNALRNNQNNPPTESTTGTTTGDGEIDNPSLKSLSDYMLNVMDKTADPCNDFYQYACGSWIENTELPSDKSVYTITVSVLRDRSLEILKTVLEQDWPMIGPFYKNCMDLETRNDQGYAPIQSWLNAIESVTTAESVVTLLAQMQKSGVSGGSFFSFYVDVDSIDPNSYLPTISQDGLGMPSREYYLNTDTQSQQTRDAYLVHIRKSLQLIGISMQNATQYASQILAFETLLAAASLSRTQMRDPYLTYNKMALQDLKDLTPEFPWDAYFASVGTSISQINVAMTNFTTSVCSLIQSTDIQLLKIYMKYHLISSTSNLLSQDFIDERFAWQHVIYGTAQPQAQWKTCAQLTDSFLSDILNRYYVQIAFPGSSKTVAQLLVNELENAFRENLKDVTWMDQPTKSAARKKLDMITNKIGYPDKWESYDSVFLQPGEFFNNYVSLANYSSIKELEYIGKPVDKSVWHMTASTVNAYYNPSANEIVFPAAILQPPFFNVSSPAFANFGSIGAVIGHEITHAFDDQGKEFDGIGNLTDWWSPSVEESFVEKAQCVVDRYSSFEVLPGLFINGRLTEGENLADLGGLRIAYLAYLSWISRNGEGMTDQEREKYFPGLTAKQLFFISFGQVWCDVATDDYLRFLTLTNPHSADKFRVMGATSNLDAFWEAFSCPVGSKMHPENACRVW